MIEQSNKVTLNLCMDNPFGGKSAMTCGLTKDGKLHNVITHSQSENWIFWHRWLRAYAVCAVTSFIACVGTSNAISSVLSIRLINLYIENTRLVLNIAQVYPVRLRKSKITRLCLKNKTIKIVL